MRVHKENLAEVLQAFQGKRGTRASEACLVLTDGREREESRDSKEKKGIQP